MIHELLFQTVLFLFVVLCVFLNFFLRLEYIVGFSRGLFSNWYVVILCAVLCMACLCRWNMYNKIAVNRTPYFFSRFIIFLRIIFLSLYLTRDYGQYSFSKSQLSWLVYNVFFIVFSFISVLFHLKWMF